MSHSDEYWMRLALEQAELAFAANEVPVGAVIVRADRVIATGHNLRERNQDPTAHAEVVAIRHAAEALGSWRLIDCCLFVTLEPCPMCAGAILQARIPRVVFGTTDLKAGACESLYRILTDDRLNHRSEVFGGVLVDESRLLLRQFFADRRAEGKK